MSLLPAGFGHAMREALHLVRERDPMAATRVIREALSGRAAPAPRPAEPPPLRPEPVAEPARPPAGAGQFVAGRYDGASGARDYKLYIPARPAPPAESRLVLMLHGCAQDPDDFAIGTRMNAVAERRGWHALYPAQPKKANITKCWNWFSPAHQDAERGEPANLAALTRHVMAAHDIRAAAVGGLSAGGAMAMIMGEVHPELFDAVLAHSGLAAGAARDLPGALAAMKSGSGPLPRRAFAPRLMVVQGLDDLTVAPRNADVIDAAVAIDGETRETRDVENGRAVTRREIRGPDGLTRRLTLRVAGLGHAWSGGAPGGSFVDPQGPDVSEIFARFIES